MLATSALSFVLVVGPALSLAQCCGQAQAAAAQLSQQDNEEGFVPIFNGKNLDGWVGSVKGYTVENGVLVCKKNGGGNLFTEKEYSDFILRFEYKLPPGGNNGVGIRAPLNSNPAYAGMEIQLLDDYHPRYAHLKPEQYNGSIYGAVAAKRGFLKPAGEWNSMEIYAKGTHIRVTLNGTVIVDADTSKLGEKSIHGHKLRGLLNKKGHIGFLGHGARVEFRNIRIKELK